MKKLLWGLAIFGLLAIGCAKDDFDEDDWDGTANLPELPDPSDVCSGMDDDTFKQYCYDNFDIVYKDGKISQAEASYATSIDLSVSRAGQSQLRSLKGICYFMNVETLKCSYCDLLESVDLSNHQRMKTLVASAFYGCSNLTSVTLPNSLLRIKGSAFYNCKSLTSITIPKSVTSIGKKAFHYCESLKSVTIPKNVTSIEERTFSNCSSLTSITIPNSITTIGDYAFVGCHSLTSVTIPNSVTTIGVQAFVSCSGLTSVTIPNSVTTIGDCAFGNCSSLTSITIPNSVTTIGNSAFSICKSLTSVTIGNGVTTIGESVFGFCESLTSIYCKAQTPPTLTGYNDISQCILYVPTGCKEAYAAADNWKNAKEIIEKKF